MRLVELILRHLQTKRNTRPRVRRTAVSPVESMEVRVMMSATHLAIGAAPIVDEIHAVLQNQQSLDSQVVQAPGQSNEAVTIHAHRILAAHNHTFEMGIIQVDDSTGKIGNLKPGDAGYALAALTSANRHVLLSSSGEANGSATIPGGSFYIVYQIQDGTAADVAAKNPNNVAGKTPVVLFSLAAANPDSHAHLHHRFGFQYGWSDPLGTQSTHFRDLIVRVRVGLPNATPDTTPPTASLSISGTVPTTTTGFNVQFSEPMKLTDLQSGNYTLTRTTGVNSGKTVPIQSVQFVNNQTVHVSVASALTAGGYRLDLAPNLADLSGNALAAPKSFNFTVA
ncbi:MAG: Ig-like domain-containing protein [Planctomycetota bacterium]